MLVNAALLVRAAAEAHSPPLWTVAVVVVVAALSMFAVGWQRHRTLVLASSTPSPHAGLLVLAAGSVWLACGAAAWSMLN